jgi:tyrosine-specific transport protein
MWIFRNKNFLYSTAAIVGTMVGAGIFGIPFTFAKSGFGVGFLSLIGVGAIILLVDLMYGEVILRTEAKHHIVGYAGLYLGKRYKQIVFFTVAFTGYAALLAYIILSGEFLNDIFSFYAYISIDSYSFYFAIIMSLLVLAGIKRVSWLELTLTMLFGVIILIILGLGIPKINLENYILYSTDNLAFLFLPYGVLLFAFSGLSGIPIGREFLDGQEKVLKKSIIYGISFVAALYLLFSLTVVGISGDITSPNAISGLFGSISPIVIVLISIFGILAISTSFLLLGTAMREMFQEDFGLGWLLSWLLVIVPPIALFEGGVRTFIDVIGLAGGFALALEAAILVMIYVRAKQKGDRVPEYSINVPKLLLYAVVIVFVAGMIQTIFFNNG